ncbi:MAG TPA: hypothetical protein VGI12_07090 [Vicinamibacterales bacterium]
MIAPIEPEPRWHALIAVIAVAGLNLALPPRLIVGPRMVLPVVVGVLLVPLVAAGRSGRHRMNHAIGLTVNVVLTLAMIASLALLVAALPAQEESGAELLISAASLWLTNILVFALWYWRLDAGGPNARDRRERHTGGAFLFPQMMTPAGFDPEAARWAPQFIDYLFLAFNSSTAFSPTDTPVLTRWGKILMIVQSLISLVALALLAARAVNILGSAHG